MMIQFSSSVPKPADEVPPVTLTPSATSWSAPSAPCAGNTTL